MFLIDWFTAWLNTPKMEMTQEIEMLGYLAMIIIFAIAAIIGIIIYGIVVFIKNRK